MLMINQERGRPPNPAIPRSEFGFDHDPGEAQANWGKAQVYLDDHLTNVHLFCLRLCYSQWFFMMAFPKESQSARILKRTDPTTSAR